MGCCNSYLQENDTYLTDSDALSYLKSLATLSQLHINRASLESTQEQENKSKVAFEIHDNKPKSPISYMHTMELPNNSNEISIDSWKNIHNQSITEFNQ